jgi:hypothetical protein
MKVLEAIGELSKLAPETEVSFVILGNENLYINLDAQLTDEIDEIWINTKRAIFNNDQITINAMVRWAFEEVHNGDVASLTNAVCMAGGSALDYAIILMRDLDQDRQYMRLFETDGDDFVFLLDEHNL